MQNDHRFGTHPLGDDVLKSARNDVVKYGHDGNLA